MKKVFGLMIMSCLIFILVGCGSTQTLTCVIEETEEFGMKMNMEYEMSFEDETLSKMKAIVSFEATSDELKESFDEFTVQLDSLYDGYESEGITLDSNIDGYVYNMILNIDLDKVSDEDLEEMDFDISGEELEMTIEEVMKPIEEEESMTCTIK